jgi:hypothetical protein
MASVEQVTDAADNKNRKMYVFKKPIRFQSSRTYLAKYLVDLVVAVVVDRFFRLAVVAVDIHLLICLVAVVVDAEAVDNVVNVHKTWFIH